MRVLGWLAVGFMLSQVFLACTKPAYAAPTDVEPIAIVSPLTDPERVVYAAIRASERHGVELWLLLCISGHETRLTTHKVGAAGEVGPVQLLSGGELVTFRQMGYLDPRSPDDSLDFLARRIKDGYLSYWSTAGLCR